MRILFLGIEPFSGDGGLAKYNRAIMQALCTHRDCRSLTYMPVTPLRAPPSRSGMPKRMQQVGTVSTVRYGRALRYRMRVLRESRRDPKGYDLLVCGHLALAPVAELLRHEQPRMRALQVVYGTEAWTPSASRRVNHSAKACEHIISVSDVTARRFREWAAPFLKSCDVLPNSLDMYRYTPGPKDPVLMARYGLRGKRVIMSLGRMVSAAPDKGHDKVLEVMPRLLRHEPDLMFLCAGSGDDRERLMAKAEHLGIGHHVVFPGKVSEIEKIQHYRLADCFVMPGWGKGFGVVFLEAMACGAPVVASLADGSHEAVLGGRLGKAVNPFNLDELEAGIMDVLRNPSPPRREALEVFSTQRFVERVHGILRGIATPAHHGDSATISPAACP